MGTYSHTEQGHLHSLREIRDNLSAARNATNIVSTVHHALTHLENDCRTTLNKLLSAKSSLEEIRVAIADAFGEFLAREEIDHGPAAEKERREALAKLQQYAVQLRDPRRSPADQLMRLRFEICNKIEDTEEDRNILDSVDPLNGDPKECRKALLTVVEAHIASGEAGKLIT